MTLGDIVQRVVIDVRKLTEYSLNPDNPLGRHKALVFERVLGFTRNNYESLLRQIETKALDAEAFLQRTDHHGHRYRVDLEVIGAQGQHGVVRTGWLVVPGRDEAWLATLYVRRSR